MKSGFGGCMKNIAVILSGCGFLDGAEIHEATLTLLALDVAGASYQCAAPSIMQTAVVNHVSRGKSGEDRNVMDESARIARCKILDVRDLKVADYDAVMIPGGYGVASNLCSLASDGPAMTVNPDVAAFLVAMHKAGKPIAALCIAPPLLAWTLKQCGVSGAALTIGNDPGTASVIKAFGQKHVECPATDCVVDAANKIVTSPAYMTAKSIGEVWSGVGKTVDALLKMI
jgi:enhancing lycopene biosynthesis protein 2